MTSAQKPCQLCMLSPSSGASRHRETGCHRASFDGWLRARSGVPLFRADGLVRSSLFCESRADDLEDGRETKTLTSTRSALAAPGCSPAGPSRKDSLRETYVKRNKGSSVCNSRRLVSLCFPASALVRPRLATLRSARPGGRGPRRKERRLSEPVFC